MPPNTPTEMDTTLDHRRLFGFRNLAEATPSQEGLEETADHLFQKRGSEAG